MDLMFVDSTRLLYFFQVSPLLSGALQMQKSVKQKSPATPQLPPRPEAHTAYWHKKH